MKQLLKKLTHGKRRTGAAPSALAFPDAAAAENYLKALAPIPTGTIQADNRITPQYDLHIIVPCYNVARTIVRCVDSILSQKTGYTFLCHWSTMALPIKHRSCWSDTALTPG